MGGQWQGTTFSRDRGPYRQMQLDENMFDVLSDLAAAARSLIAGPKLRNLGRRAVGSLYLKCGSKTRRGTIDNASIHIQK